MGGPDPFGLHLETLDDTPWYLSPDGGRSHPFDNRRGTERSLGHCNPYGYEDDNPRVMGGVNNPDAEPYRWQCRNWAEGRYWMTCVNGHRGRVILCRGHVYAIQFHHSRAKNGLCPRCAWPPRARELDEKMNHLMRQLSDPYAYADERARWALALEDARHEMDELRQRGTITSGAPLRLEEVS